MSYCVPVSSLQAILHTSPICLQYDYPLSFLSRCVARYSAQRPPDSLSNDRQPAYHPDNPGHLGPPGSLFQERLPDGSRTSLRTDLTSSALSSQIFLDIRLSVNIDTCHCGICHRSRPRPYRDRLRRSFQLLKRFHQIRLYRGFRQGHFRAHSRRFAGARSGRRRGNLGGQDEVDR
jgi:hypothetical protein